MNDHVYRRLRSLLLDDGFEPGSALCVDDLAQRVGGDCGAVDAALGRLGLEGLVVQVPDRGIALRRFQADEVRELVEIRTVIETAAARLVIERASDAELREVVAMQRAAEAVLARGGEVARDRDFHGEIARLSGNRELTRSLGLIYDQLRLARPPAMRRGARARVAWREHGAILRAILARDAAAAVDAVTAHLESVAGAVLAGHT